MAASAPARLPGDAGADADAGATGAVQAVPAEPGAAKAEPAPAYPPAGPPRLLPLPRPRPLPSGGAPREPGLREPGRGRWPAEDGWVDVLEAPAPAGTAALLGMERAGVPLGPVARLLPDRRTSGREGRLLFLLAPHTAEAVPGLLQWLGWDGVPLDLAARRLRTRPTALAGPRTPLQGPSGLPAAAGTGRTSTVAPQPRHGAGSLLPDLLPDGAVWLRPPAAHRPLPGPDVRADAPLPRLLSALADACARALLSAAARVPTGRPPTP